MSRETKHNNCDSDDDSSSWSSEDSRDDRDGRTFIHTPTIVCPTSDFQKRYEASSSESSCPDFSDLCKEKPRRRCRKGQQSDSSDESWDSEDESSKSRSSSCSGCDKKCTTCDSCQACKCRDCSDYSLSSVLSSLGPTESSCPDFTHLVLGRKSKKKHCDKQCSDCDDCKSCGCRTCKDVSVSSVISSKSQSDTALSVKPRGQPKKAAPATQVNRPTARAPMRAADAPKEIAEVLRHMVTQEVKPAPLEILSEIKKESATNSNRGKKFSVAFVPTEGHKWEHYNTGDHAININGSLGPTIHLYSGKSYVFSVTSEDNHALVLTDKPDGGEGSRIVPGGFEPVSSGNVRFHVTPDTPRYFFYHCAKHQYEGGQAIVHTE